MYHRPAFGFTLLAIATLAAFSCSAHTLLKPSPEVVASPRILPHSERILPHSILQVTPASNVLPRGYRYYEIDTGKLHFEQQSSPDAGPIIGYHPESGRYLTLDRDLNLQARVDGADPIDIDLDLSRGEAALLDDGEHIFFSSARSYPPGSAKSQLFSISQNASLWQQSGNYTLSADQSRAIELQPLGNFTTSFGSGISLVKAIDLSDGSLLSEIDLATPYPNNTYRLAAASPDQSYLLLIGTTVQSSGAPQDSNPSLLIVDTVNGTAKPIENATGLSPYLANPFSPDGSSFLLWDNLNRTLKAFRSSDGSLLFAKAAASPFAAFSPQAPILYLSTNQAGAISAIDIPSGQSSASYQIPADSTIAALAVSPDGKHLAATAGDTAYQLDLQTGATAQFPILNTPYLGIKFSPDSQYWILSSLVGSTIAVPTDDPSDWKRLIYPSAESLLGPTSEGALTYLTESNSLAERQLESGELALSRIDNQGANSTDILASSPTSWLVRRTTLEQIDGLFSQTQSIHLIDTESGSSQWETPLNSFGVTHTAMDQAGEIVAAIEKVSPYQVLENDNRLIAYRKQENTPFLKLENTDGNFLALSISPDGSHLATLQQNSNGTSRPRLLRCSDSAEIQLPSEASGRWNQIRFGHHNRRLYLFPSSTQLGRVHYQIAILDLDAPSELTPLNLYGEAPSGLLDISPDGRYLVALSRRSHLILVDLEKGEIADEAATAWFPNNVYMSNFGPVREQAHFAADSASFLYRDTQGSVRNWQLQTYSLVAARLQASHETPTIAYPYQTDSSYLLEHSTDLLNWEVLQKYKSGEAPATLPFPPSDGPAPQFYRIWKSDSANQ